MHEGNVTFKVLSEEEYHSKYIKRDFKIYKYMCEIRSYPYKGRQCTIYRPEGLRLAYGLHVGKIIHRPYEWNGILRPFAELDIRRGI